MGLRPGRVILLHGASSSGKSTLARELQACLPEPYLRLSFDTLRDGGAFPGRERFEWSSMRASVFTGLHHMVGACVRAGNNVLFEHILDTDGWMQDVQSALCGLDVFWFGVHCRLETLVARELTRGDRAIGSAQRDFASVHAGMRYDIHVNGEGDPAAQAARVVACLRKGYA